MTVLRAEFNRRGDRRKNQARTMFNAAFEIVEQGENNGRTG
jgi:hypothetical protein